MAVERPDPRLRTERGKSSDCCQGTQPVPTAYAATYRIMLMSIRRGEEEWIDSFVEPFTRFVSDGMLMKWKEAAQARRAKIMTGTERRRMRRRPRRSMSRRERIVKAKLVSATDRDVRVGVAKPMREKMVAEKYMSEFCGLVSAE